jgi:hypothetical protein
MGLMTTSSTANDTKAVEAKRRRRDERLDRILVEAEVLLEEMRRSQIRREVIDELEGRRWFGSPRRF